MFLILDTATSRGLVALCSDRQVVVQKELLLGLANSRTLEPSLQELLRDAGITINQLTFVAVGRGPGSYTGLRVGAASAKAISIGCKIPLVAFNSLQVFIPPKEYEGQFLSAVDAKIGGVYTLLGRRQEGKVSFTGDEQLMPLDQFESLAATIGCIVTPQKEPLVKRLTITPKIFEVSPSVEVVVDEVREKFAKKEYTFDGTLALSYLRLTQAEMEKLPNKGQLR